MLLVLFHHWLKPQHWSCQSSDSINVCWEINTDPIWLLDDSLLFHPAPIIPPELCGTQPPFSCSTMLSDGRYNLVITICSVTLWIQQFHPNTCPHPLAAISRYTCVEVSSYRSGGGTAGVFLRHGGLIHRQPLFHRHLLGLLVLGARDPVLGKSWSGSTCAARSYTQTERNRTLRCECLSVMHANRTELDAAVRQSSAFSNCICFIITAYMRFLSLYWNMLSWVSQTLLLKHYIITAATFNGSEIKWNELMCTGNVARCSLWCLKCYSFFPFSNHNCLYSRVWYSSTHCASFKPEMARGKQSVRNIDAKLKRNTHQSQSTILWFFILLSTSLRIAN